MIPVRQSTAFEIAIGPVLDADGVAVTNCVVADFKLKKTTGNFAALNGSATLTHVSAGVYDLVLTTSDTDTVGLCCIAIDDTVNACQSLYLQVMEEATYDDLYAASAVGYLKPTTAGRTLDVTATGAAGIDWANVENQSTSVNLSATTTNLVNTATTLTNAVASVTGAVGSVTGNVGGNVTGSVGSVVGAVGSVTGNVGGNVTGSVGSVASGGITRASFAADTGLQTIRSNTAQGGSTSSITLDASASAVNNFYDGMRCRITGGTGVGQEALLYQYNGTTKAAAVAPTWKTAPDNTSTFAITGTGASDFQLLAGVESYMGGVADFFQQFSDNGTVTGFATDTELAKVPKSDSNVTWNATAAAQIQSEATDALNAYDPPTNAEMEARTLPSADYGTNTDVDAILALLDTEIADISSRLPAALVSGRMDSNMQAAANDVITAAVIAAGAIDRATFAADTGLQTIRSNTAQGGSTSSITLDASASAVNNFYNGMRCRITGGTGVGQEALLYQYNGTTKAAAVAPTWKTAPDNTSTFAITGTGAADFQLLTGVESYMGGVATFFQEYADNGVVTGFASDTELAKVPKSDSNVTWNATALASIQSEATDALNAYDPPTNAEMEARTLPSADYGTNTDVDAILALLDTEFPALVTTVGSLFTTARTEAYRTDGAAGTIDQLLYEIVGHLGESSISSVTKTMKKIDGSTTAMTFTLSDATTPTSITRAT